MLALGAVYAITFVVLLAVAQRCGAVLFLPVIGVQGIAVARAVDSLPWRGARWTGRAAAVALSLHHLLSLTLGVNPAAGDQDFRGPFGNRFPLWDHNDTFLAVTEHSKPRADYATGLAETARRVLAEPSVRDGPVLLLAHHPFVNVSNLLAEAPAWPRSVFLTRLPVLTENAVLRELPYHTRNVMAARVVLTRVSAPGDAVPEEVRYLEILKRLTSGPTRVFDRADPPIPFADGSTIVVHVRRPELDAAAGALLADLERRPVFPGGTIAFLSDHVLFELLAIDLREWHIRQGRGIEVTLPVAEAGVSSDGCLTKALELAERGSLIVTRGPAETPPSPREAAWSPYLTALRLGSTPLVTSRLPDIVLPDGSTVRVEEYNESADALAGPMARRVVEALKERVAPAVAVAADSPIVAALRQHLGRHASDGGWSLFTFPGPCDFDASLPPLDADAVRRAREAMGRADVLVKCFDAQLDAPLVRAARRAVAPLVSGPTRRFEPLSAAAGGGTLTTRTGAEMRLFASVPSVEWPAAAPAGWTPLDAPFEPPPGSLLAEAAVKLVAYDVHNSDGWVRIDLGLTPLADRDHLPSMTVRVRGRGDAKAVVLDPLTHGRSGVKGQTGRIVVARGYLALGAGERSGAGPVAIDVGAVSFGTWTPWRGAVEIPIPPDEGVK
jgi:hypothetical protein